MKTLRTSRPEPIHLAVLRGVVYAGAVLVFVAPIATWIGTIAALLAVPAGLALSRLAVNLRLRRPLTVIAAIAFLFLGLSVESVLGGPRWSAHLLGARTVLGAGEGLALGLATLGAVFGLRTLAAGTRVLGGLEVVVVAAVVVGLFSGHRDSQISQPRFLTDWVFSQGYDPKMVLLGIGLMTFAACALLLMQSERPVRTVPSLLGLLVVCVCGFSVLWRYLPDFNDPAGSGAAGTRGKASASNSEPSADPNEKPDDSLTFSPPPREQRPRPMAIVSLQDDLGANSEGLYFRSNAFSQFNGSRLVRAVEAGFDLDVPLGFPTKRQGYPAGPLDPRIGKLVPMRISLIAPHAQPLGLVNVQAMEPRENLDPRTFMRTYSITSKVLSTPWFGLPALKAGDPTWPKAAWSHYLAGPADPRYRQLAEKIIAEAIEVKSLKPEYQNSPVLRAMAIKRWLEKNTIYTRNPVVPDGVDPTTSFLFGDHRGYCVHLAHAMAYLLRSLGIPARTAGGYMVGSERRGTGSSILLQSTDLHSWPEIYLERVGWVVVDASPERSEDPHPPGADAAAQSHFGERNRPVYEAGL